MIEGIELYEIFVDLDGVVADFEKRALELAGYAPDHDPKNKVLRKDFWKKVQEHVRIPGNTFFESMDKMHDADELWNYIEHRYPTILSAHGNHLLNGAVEKRNWVRKQFGHATANAALFVRDAADKAQYALPNRILIDDRRKAIDPWIEAGGIGILHKSAASSIAQLKELGL